MPTINVYKLEKKLIPPNKWNEVPKQLIEEALKQPLNEASKEVPLGIGYTEETGWYILMSGQGPFIFWMENEDKGFYSLSQDGRCDRWTYNKKDNE